MFYPRSTLLHFLIAWCALLSVQAATFASTHSHDFIVQGAKELDARHFDAALQNFRAAEADDPKDSQAVFFEGVALNRLSRHAEALEKLRQAEDMADLNPTLEFEIGWAELSQGNYEAALKALKVFDRINPGRGQAAEFLGRAYMGLNRDAEAKAEFDEALRRDPALAPTVRIYLAALAERNHDSAGAKSLLASIAQDYPNSPTGRIIHDQLTGGAKPAVPELPQSATEKPWRFSLTLAGGYNSNPINLGEGTPLPTDISHKDSPAFGISLTAACDLIRTSSDTLTAEYDFASQLYDGSLKQADSVDNAFLVSYHHQFTGQLGASLRLDDDYTLIDGSGFRNQFAARGGVDYKFLPWATTELAYAYAYNNYYFPAPAPAFDRTGSAHILALNEYLKIPNTHLEAQLGYFHAWNLADGSDFDFHSDAVSVSLSHPLIWKITGDLSYAHTFDRYDHPNSAAADGRKRNDGTDAVSISFSRPINQYLKVFVGYTYIHADSNIGFYSYDQHVVAGGLTLSF